MIAQTRIAELLTIPGERMRWSTPLLAGALLMLSAATLGYSQLPIYGPAFLGPVTTSCNSGIVACSTSSAVVSEVPGAALTIQFTAAPSLCSSVQVTITADGTLVGTSGLLAPGQSMTPIATGVVAGFNRAIDFQPTFQVPGCNSGNLFTFGTATITPQAAPVPALSPWGILLLAVSLTGLSAWTMRKWFREGYRGVK